MISSPEPVIVEFMIFTPTQSFTVTAFALAMISACSSTKPLHTRMANPLVIIGAIMPEKSMSLQYARSSPRPNGPTVSLMLVAPFEFQI